MLGQNIDITDDLARAERARAAIRERYRQYNTGTAISTPEVSKDSGVATPSVCTYMYVGNDSAVCVFFFSM
jgi:hypothetical protein